MQTPPKTSVSHVAVPRHVSVHGKPPVVVDSSQQHSRLNAQKFSPSFTALMCESPLVGLDLDTARLKDPVRAVQLND